MAQIYLTRVIMNGNVVADRKVSKMKPIDLINAINRNSDLSKKKLYVSKDQQLALSHSHIIDSGEYQGMKRIVTYSIPLKGDTLKLLSEYHFDYYDWLINSGKANGSSMLRVLRLTSQKHIRKIEPIVDSIDTIGTILADFGLRSSDFFQNAISYGSKKQMDIVFKREKDLHETANFLYELSANKDLADANGNKLGDNTFILSLLTNASKGYTLSPKQIASGMRTIGLYKHHASKGTALREWKFASDESDLRKKVIRLAHQNPHLRSHLLPLLMNKKALKGDLFTFKGKNGEKVNLSYDLSWGFEVSKGGKIIFEESHIRSSNKKQIIRLLSRWVKPSKRLAIALENIKKGRKNVDHIPDNMLLDAFNARMDRKGGYKDYTVTRTSENGVTVIVRFVGDQRQLDLAFEPEETGAEYGSMESEIESAIAEQVESTIYTVLGKSVGLVEQVALVSDIDTSRGLEIDWVSTYKVEIFRDTRLLE